MDLGQLGLMVVIHFNKLINRLLSPIEQINYTLIAENCNIWRNYIDIQDTWDSVLKIIDYYAENQDTLTSVSGPGHFNDPDMVP